MNIQMCLISKVLPPKIKNILMQTGSMGDRKLFAIYLTSTVKNYLLPMIMDKKDFDRPVDVHNVNFAIMFDV